MSIVSTLEAIHPAGADTQPLSSDLSAQKRELSVVVHQQVKGLFNSSPSVRIEPLNGATTLAQAEIELNAINALPDDVAITRLEKLRLIFPPQAVKQLDA